MIGEHVQPGITTEELDAICNRFIVEELKAIPANVGYMGFTKTICTSVNHVVCHGIPKPSRTEGRGHHQHRRRDHQGWLFRRYQPHVLRRYAEPRSQAAVRHDV